MMTEKCITFLAMDCIKKTGHERTNITLGRSFRDCIEYACMVRKKKNAKINTLGKLYSFSRL